MEFIIAFPVVLTLIMGCIQFAHLLVARQVVHYAAVMAGRAALVSVCANAPDSYDLHNDSWPTRDQLTHEGFQNQFTQGGSVAGGRNGRALSEGEWAACKVASQICALITLGSNPNIASPKQIPGWGTIDGSESADRKTRAVVEFDDASFNVSVTVEHDFALITPIVGPMIAWGMDPFASANRWLTTQTDVTGDVHAGLDTVPYPHLRLTETVWLSKPYRTIIAQGNWQNGSDSWRSL